MIKFIDRIRSGHKNLNSALYKYKITETNLCKCNCDIDSIDHIFWQCKLFNSQRDMMNSMRKIVQFGPFLINSFFLKE